MKKHLSIALVLAMLIALPVFAEEPVVFEFDSNPTEETAESIPEDMTLIASAVIEPGEDEAVLHNIGVAAGSIYDYTLSKGDRFSFNKVVGPRQEENGFVKAVNGRGAEVVGGGVAQIASGLWLCVRDLDCVSISEKSTYGDKYNQHYVESSADAILVDWKNGADFSFRYNGEGTLTIYTYLDNGALHCELYERP